MKKKTKSATKKQPAGKRTVVKKTAAKRTPVTKRKSAARKRAPRKSADRPAGYMVVGETGFLVPAGSAAPVPPRKIRSGIARAREEISRLMQDLSDLTEGFEVAEIELAASFSADGKFLGIGVGGATTISIRFKPEDDSG